MSETHETVGDTSGETEGVEQEKNRSRLWLLTFGERAWEKYVFWVPAIFFIFDFVIRDFAVAPSWNEALELALLFIIAGYLSEMRYRFFKDVRADARR